VEAIMAVDIIMRARQRREQLAAELARLDVFLEMAAELARDKADSPPPERTVSRPRHMAARGVGADTVAAALEIVRRHGPLATRALLPLITARGIPIGGKSEIATLSARLSTSGKGIIRMSAGRWRAAQQDEAQGPETVPEREESADPSMEGRSTDSLFHIQTKEDRYAAALA
jgi:hypothetical protein